MTTFEYLNSLIGKTVDYDFGGASAMKMKVGFVKSTPWCWTDEQGVEHNSNTYAISENGWSWYTVNEHNVTGA